MPTLPWTTPKPSPRPPDGPVTVMASRLELRRLRHVLPFLAAALRIRRQMLGSPGWSWPVPDRLAAAPHILDPVGLAGRHGLRAATRGEPHVQLMIRFRPLMAASSFVTWTATNLPVPWDQARRRLDKPDTVHGRG